MLEDKLYISPICQEEEEEEEEGEEEEETAPEGGESDLGEDWGEE